MQEVEDNPLRCIICQRVIVSGHHCFEHIPSDEESHYGNRTEKKGGTKKEEERQR